MKITYDSQIVPSLVIPHTMPPVTRITQYRGHMQHHPYLKKTTALLLSAEYERENDVLHLVFKAMPGHHNLSKIVLHKDFSQVICDGLIQTGNWKIIQTGSISTLHIETTHKEAVQQLSVIFK